jgi:hypothetical protein
MTVESRIAFTETSVKNKEPQGVEDGVSVVPKIVILRKPDEIESLDPSTRFVHLAAQSVVNIATVQALVKMCPDLEVVQTVPGYKRIVGPTFEGTLEEARVKLRYGRIHRKNLVPNWFNKDKRYLEKKAFFEAALVGEKKEQFEEMLRLGVPDAIWAIAYFGKNAMTLDQIAVEYDFPAPSVQLALSTILTWLGLPTTSKNVEARVRNLPNRIEGIKKEWEKIKAEEEEEEFYIRRIRERTLPNALD